MSISAQDYKSHSYGLSGAIASLTSGNNGNNNGAAGYDTDDSALVVSYNGSGIISSMATLSNIGNSCYLNSVIYTLRFAPSFMHNLHHLVDDLNFINQFNQQNSRQKSASLGRNQQLNVLAANNGHPTSNGRSLSNKDLVSMNSTTSGSSNGLGSLSNGVNTLQDSLLLKCNRQTATEKLHELYQNLTRNEQNQIVDPYQPVQLLNAVQDVSTTFEGNQQQDAHEFLMCILDAIRETCQTLKKRFAESAEIQRRTVLNGADYCIAEAEPSTLSTMQILPPSNHHSNNTPFKSFFNLKKKSKRKDEKAPPVVIKSAAKVPEIVVDYNTAPVGSAPADENAFDDASSSSVDKKGALESGSSDKEKLGSDFFSDDFEGITVSTTKCLSCETETEQKETMIDISIPIAGQVNVDSQDNPQVFFQNSCITREYFRGDNKYRCEKCSAYTEAIRSISFEVLPRLLIIQLKRFNGGMEKINSFIPTPFVLQCFCRKCFSQPNEKKHHIYKLYSVITHVGATMSAGHYITYTSSLDCYCDYMNCVKESEKMLKFSSGQIGSKVKKMGNATHLVNGVESDYEVDGKFPLNLSNPGGHEKNSNINLIEKLKKNRLFKNRAGNRAKINSTSSSVPSSSSQHVEAMNSHNELIERHLNDASAAAQKNSSNSQPQLCRGLSCCSIKAKASFLVKNGLDKVQQSNGEGSCYCNNAKHQAKLNGGGNCENGEIMMDTALTASTSSSSSSASNSSKFIQNGGTGGSFGKSRGNVFMGQSEEPTWYMCDDDKIKSMPQHEFKELLSSNRKIAITPYLLFYARNDL